MKPPLYRHPLFCWSIWLLILALWTVGLLMPDPFHRAGGESLELSKKLLVAKSAHLGVYALLTGAISWLPVRPHHRWLLVAGLAGHAVLTETLQLFMVSRSGTVWDVCIDLLGIGLGLAAARLVPSALVYHHQ